ncbi:MAG: VCBS repeat-containing protein, partial [Balneolaceae bacterium]
MPQILVSNYMFRNNGDNTFTNVTDSMGLSRPGYSSGAVYTDLNNDGFLDLVTNNINEKAAIYENRTTHNDSTHFLKIKLTGDGPNSTGIGSKVFLYKDDIIFSREQNPVRGFQSSVDQTLHIGLADHTNIDSLLVIWPDDRYQVLYDVDSNLTLELFQFVASDGFNYELLHQKTEPPLLSDITEQTKLSHRHRENSFDDMNREPLIPYKLSSNGPALAIADVNGDGLDDIYIGGATGFEGKLMMQQDDGSYLESAQPVFFEDRGSEDVDALFFDATGDGYPDLYVVSGGNEFTQGSPELLDRLYINTGNGEFRRSVNSIPEFTVNGSVVKAADINGNGHLDLFVGGHSVPWRYGVGPQSFILLNNGNGVFQDATEEIAPELQTLGNVTTAEWIHQPGKELPDLIVTGEWMPIQYFENQDGTFTKRTDEKGFQKTNGLWQTVTVSDLTGNGFPDIIAGNFGINSRLKSSLDSPLNLYVNDFDDNGQTAPVLSYFVDGVEKPFEHLDEIRAQIPDITNRVRSYRDFASKQLHELFDQKKLDEALKKQIYELRSIVLLNRGDGTYHKEYLPFDAQLFPVKSILAGDITGNGFDDLLLAGNIYDVKPSIGGRQDAGYGLLLTGDGTGSFKPIYYQESGFFVKGEVRSILPLNEQNGDYHIIVARNNNSPLIFRRNVK